MKARSDGIPTFERLAGEIYLRHQELEPTAWSPHSHPWGQLNYVSHGTMVVEVLGRRFLSPPHYAVWIPPEMEHTCFNAGAATYRSVYLSVNFSKKLPKSPCALTVSKLLRALLEEFARTGVRSPETPQELAMAQVALDQIEAAAPLNSYLPCAVSENLQAVLDDVKKNPRDKRSTESIASKFHMTARTLERRCNAELGIGFGEWQQRFRFMLAIDALDAGHSIQQVAFDLGYSSPSAFISMFHRLSGQTPEKYRRSNPSD